MLTIIGITFLFYLIAELAKQSAANKARRREQERQARIEAEMRRAKEERRRIVEENKRIAAEQIEQAKAQARLEREQARQAAEQQRQAELLRKHEERISQLEFKVSQAQDDIDNLAYRIEQAQEYSIYLERERDACVIGSKEYFKWHNKVMAQDDKIYRMTKQMNKAQFERDNAQRQIDAA